MNNFSCVHIVDTLPAVIIRIKPKNKKIKKALVA